MEKIKNENVEEIKNVEIKKESENSLTLFSDLKSKTYCSKNLSTIEDKKQMLNALESCDVLLNDCVGQEIEIKDLYIEERTVLNEETGVVQPKYRTIIFGSNGQTYATGAYGVYNILRKIVQIYGLPDTWANPVKAKVAKKPIGNGKQSLTLVIL